MRSILLPGFKKTLVLRSIVLDGVSNGSTLG